MRTDELLDLQIETAFRLAPLHLAPDGRILATREPGGVEAPRLFLGRSARGNRCLVRHDVPADVRDELRAIAAREPVVDDLETPRTRSVELRAALEAHAPVTREWLGPAWRLPALQSDDPEVALLGPADADRLKSFFADWIPDLEGGQPCLALVIDGAAVSLCCSARNGPHAAEASLHTAEHARGRGYARRVTRAWAHAVQRGGRVALYSTAWSNGASRRVAAALGGELYGEDFHLT